MAKTKRNEHIESISEYSRKLAMSGMLLAISVVLGMFRVTTAIAGSGVLRLSWSAPFLDLAAALFGPLFGGVIRAVADVLSFLLRPDGPYLWPLTVTEFLKGLTIGFLFKRFRKVGDTGFAVAYLTGFCLLPLWGAVNVALAAAAPHLGYVDFMMKALKIGSMPLESSYRLISVIAIITGGAGVAAFLIDYRFVKGGENRGRFIKLFVSICAPSLVVTTINTKILLVFGIIPAKAFLLAWTPRFVWSFAVSLVSSWIVTLLLEAYKRLNKERVTG